LNKLLYSLLSFAFFVFSACSQSTETTGVNPEIPPIENDTVRLFFVGDAMGHHPMISKAWDSKSKSYNYDNWFKFIKPHLNKYDYCLVNLEVTLAGSPYKGYPRFSSPDNFAKALKKTGFDLFCTSNNHSFDRGESGLKRTIKTLENISVDHVGTYQNKTIRDSIYPFITEIKGHKFAFLNYTYGTEVAVRKPSIVNFIDTNQIKTDIKRAIDKGASCIISIIHWGEEYKIFENDFQKNHAQWLADHGVDAIVGMHPHVVQPMKVLYSDHFKSKKIPVAFSLGNFVSRHSRKQNIGIGIEMSFIFNNKKPKWDDWAYTPIWTQEMFSPRGHFPLFGKLIDDICSNKNTELKLDSNQKSELINFNKKTRNHLKGISEINWIK
tara:strand:+ start:1352 stop:2494 length:1143 start_codon:yes stop_codon:yes gene_type:complete